MSEEPESPQQLLGQLYPTPFQRKVGWMALTGFNCFVIGALGIALIWVLNWTLSFLQPILIPVAVAGILAYLLEPIVLWLRKKWGWGDRSAVLVVYVCFNLLAAGLLIFVLSRAMDEAIQIAQPENIQEMSEKIGTFCNTQLDNIEGRFPGVKGTREWITDGGGVEWAKNSLSPLGDQLWGYVTGSLGKVFSFLGYIFG
ncbi:MAG: putative PurR-regulated permease PerM, partial [Verrucomicrobiales bacterium]